MHTNELPLKHLMAEFGVENYILQSIFWSGMELLHIDKLTNLRVRDIIPKQNLKRELIELREEDMNIFSYNQKYL